MRAKIIPALALCSLLSVLGGAATPIEFNASDIFGVRDTNLSVEANQPPVWSGVQASYALTNGAVGSIDLRPRCVDPEGTSVAISKTAGTYNTGLSDSTAGLITGTPTVNGTQTVTMSCTDGLLAATVTFDIVVSGSPTPDTTPAPFDFPPQVGVTKDTADTPCGTITVLGTNAAAPVTIANSHAGMNAEYRINAGSYTSGAGSAPPNATIDVRFDTPDLYNVTRTATLTVGGVPGDCSMTTEASPGLNDIYYTLDFEGMSPAINPYPWPVSQTAAHNGLLSEPISRSDWGQPAPGTDSNPSGEQPNCVNGSGATPTNTCDHPARTAAVASLTHWEIVRNGTDPAPLAGTGEMYLRGTLYIRPYQVNGYYINYCDTNGGGCGASNGDDKPRNDLRNQPATKHAFDLNPNHGRYRTTQYFSMDLGIPSDYVHETQKRITIMQMPSADTTPQNNMDMSITPNGATGSKFELERLLACAPGSGCSDNQAKTGSSSGIPVPSLPINLATMSGKIITFVWKIDVDNCPLSNVGGDDCPNAGNPSFKWMYSIQGQDRLTTIWEDNATTRWGYSPFIQHGSSNPGPENALEYNLTLPYCGGCNGKNGAYNGPYRNRTMTFILDNVRAGGTLSSVSDVHPLRFAEPTCGTPGNAATYPCHD